MQIVKLTFNQQARDVATANGVVLDSNSTFRYVFVPQIINNHNDSSKSVKGEIIVQKKSQKDQWENHNTLSLNQLRKNEYFKVGLNSSRLELMINYCMELKKTYAEKGYELFNSKKTLIIDDELADPEIEEIVALLKKSPSINEIIKKLSEKEIDSKFIADLINSDNFDVSAISDSISTEKSNQLYYSLRCNLINTAYLKQNLTNANEEFWQTTFKQNPHILFSVIPLMGQIIQSQPYFGGKAITNINGNVGDFLYKYGENNCGIVEIKTPLSRLIDKTSYRSGVYAPSKDLLGSIVQIKTQRDSFMKEYYAIKGKSTEDCIYYEGYEPSCYIITGDNSNFDKDEKRSFELFRRELRDINIITYNELIHKLELIQEAMQ
ncbi:MAG: Shedu immune nuclease family protein [Eubacteriales bacterium]